MKILLYSLNYAPELVGIGKYSGEMAEWLTQKGHQVSVVCAPPYYPEWRVNEGYRSWKYHNEVLNQVKLFRCPLFVPKNPSLLSRVLHLFSFGLSSFPVMFRLWSWKPDVVMVIEPTFFCLPTALFLCKLTGAKSLLHIQDFELDAMIGLGFGLKNHSLWAQFWYSIETFVMCRFDAISTISHSMIANAGKKSKYSVPLHYFPNWVDTDFVSPKMDAILIRKRWNIPETMQVVLYSGNIGKKQGLNLVIQAAKLMANEKDVLFMILGDGAEKQKLIDQAKQLTLDNIRFDALQPYADLPALMAFADVHLVIQKRGVANAVLPSKLTTIFSAGGYALISAEAETEMALLCEEFYGIAERIEPENVEQLVTALRKMLMDAKKGRPKINKVARQYAKEHLNKELVLQKFENMLKDLISESN
jgi:colanic acid biosynthesis glycosyl transferase WcaI